MERHQSVLLPCLRMQGERNPLIDWLLIEILQHLSAERISDCILLVEVLQCGREDIDRITFFDSPVGQLLLLFSLWEDTVFGDIGTVSICRLGVFRHGGHCCVPSRHRQVRQQADPTWPRQRKNKEPTVLIRQTSSIASYISIGSLLLFLREFRDVVPVLLETVSDFIGNLRSSQFQQGIVVECPILCLLVFAPELLAFYSENLHSNTSWCGDVVGHCGVQGFSISEEVPDDNYSWR